MTTTTAAPALSHTPFHDFHLAHNAKMVPFVGWDMPLHYGSIIEEHKQVRRSGGMFDVSHMGRLRFTGKDARLFLDRVCTRQIYGMTDGQIRYSLICNEQGGCKDDVLVYRLGETEYLMVCNAANRAKLLDHFAAVKEDMVFKLKDETESTAMLAVQGPKVIELIAGFSESIASIKRYRFSEKRILIAKLLISRTGYTGEDGVEIILPSSFAGMAIKKMLSEFGEENDLVKPTGLGARDSLRLEAGMALYGHEITETIDPVSAGLHFAIKYGKGDDNPEIGRYIGQDVLEKIKAEGPKQKLSGLILEGRRAARQDMKVFSGEKEIGFITSGCLSPTLEKSIAMAYLNTDCAHPGETVSVDLGRQKIAAEIVSLPFYKAPK